MRTVRGFTLIELAFVVAGISILAALAVPSYQLFIRRAQVAEARTVLEGIAQAENGYHRDHGKFIACEPSGSIPRGTIARFDASAAGWKELGFSVDGPVRYSYQVVLAGNGFRAVAHGDLDGNGKASTFTLQSEDGSLQVEDELE